MQRLLPRFRPRAAHRPVSTRPSGDAISIRWLGTAGHVISAGGTTLLVDPYLSRPRFRSLLGPIEPDPSRYAGWLPQRVDAILLGHSHFDHLLDAPAIALQTGALVVGTATTCAFARASGVPEARLVTVPHDGLSLKVGAFDVRFVPSLHGRLLLGRVPLPGEVRAPPALPVPFWHYKMGGAYGIHLAVGGRRVYHNGSADLVDAELAGLRAEVLLVGLAGRFATHHYVERLTGLLGPSVVVPTHHDAFFGPLEDGERLLPGIDLAGFERDLDRAAPRAKLLTPLYRDELFVPFAGDAREAVVVPG